MESADKRWVPADREQAYVTRPPADALGGVRARSALLFENAIRALRPIGSVGWLRHHLQTRILCKAQRLGRSGLAVGGAVPVRHQAFIAARGCGSTQADGLVKVSAELGGEILDLTDTLLSG
jgi:hypothetical protein